jgi:beta-galactosidase GanA
MNDRTTKFSWILLTVLFAKSFALPQSQPKFAPDKMDNVLYGVAYYTEYMPYDRLDKDVEMMRQAGISVVRIGDCGSPKTDALNLPGWIELSSACRRPASK